MIAMIGSDPQTGTLRWTFDSLYLWDGMPLVPVSARPLRPARARRPCHRPHRDRRRSAGKVYTRRPWHGVKDVFRHWWLVLRCSWLGAALGAVPGIGASVIDWVAYGHASRTEKGASQTFGKGDVRGVIASESSNNAKEGGALVPTIAFGVPGSASMAILLGAFLIHGLVPGPEMLTKNSTSPTRWSGPWRWPTSSAPASASCSAGSSPARDAALHGSCRPSGDRVPRRVPGQRQWGDLYALLVFGVLGWMMKQHGWPRPPLMLGFVLGDLLERYMFISVELYGTEWIFPTSLENARWVVLVMFALSIAGLLRPLFVEYRNAGGIVNMARQLKPSARRFDVHSVMYLLFIGMFLWMMSQAWGWNHDARIIPEIVGYFALGILAISLLNYTFKSVELGAAGGSDAESQVRKSLHLDIEVRGGDMPKKLIALRAAGYLGWLLAYLGTAALIGMVPALFLFVVAYMKIEGNEVVEADAELCVRPHDLLDHPVRQAPGPAVAADGVRRPLHHLRRTLAPACP